MLFIVYFEIKVKSIIIKKNSIKSLAFFILKQFMEYPTEVKNTDSQKDNTPANKSCPTWPLTREEKAQNTCQEWSYEHIVADLRSLPCFRKCLAPSNIGNGSAAHPQNCKVEILNRGRMRNLADRSRSKYGE